MTRYRRIYRHPDPSPEPSAHAQALCRAGQLPIFISQRQLQAAESALLRLKYSRDERDFIPARFVRMAYTQGWFPALARILAINTRTLTERQHLLVSELLLPHPVFGRTTPEQLAGILRRLHLILKDAI